jgi:hypothetical protein
MTKHEDTYSKETALIRWGMHLTFLYMVISIIKLSIMAFNESARPVFFSLEIEFFRYLRTFHWGLPIILLFCYTGWIYMRKVLNNPMWRVIGWFFSLTIFTSLSTYVIISYLNRSWDTSDPEEHAVLVLDKPGQTESFGKRSYVVYVENWRDDSIFGDEVGINIRKADYFPLVEGESKITLYTRRGFFGCEWLESYSVAK